MEATDTTSRELRIAGAERRRGLDIGKLASYVALYILAVIFILPLLWMLSTALKLESAVYTDPGIIPAEPTLRNFEFIMGGAQDAPVFQWLINTAITATIGSVLVVLLVSLSAYAFARIDFVGSRALFALLIATLLLPGIMFLVPQFQIVVALGDVPLLGQLIGTNTYGAFMIPHLAGVFGVFFMRQFFLGIPVELEEAAYVDGASRLRTWWSVIMPLAGPAVATLGIITFLGIWNDYLWPLVTCEGEGCTLQAGLRNLQGQYTAEFGILMAGAVLAAIPVLTLYILAQKWIVQAVTSSGVKG